MPDAPDTHLALELLRRLPIPPADLDSFSATMTEFWRLLGEGNAKKNLTRILDWKEFVVKHVFDSLAISGAVAEIADNNLRVADIGCGAGFPSIPLAAAYPDLEVVAIDSNAAKIGFVADAAEKLGLANLTAVRGRGRELARREELKGEFDLVTARAVATLRILFREIRGLAAPNGKMVFYKTPNAIDDELPELLKLRESGDFEWSRRGALTLPLDMGDREFVVGAAVGN